MHCRSLHILSVPLLLGCFSLVAQTNLAEKFDLSGLPSRPTNFAEQRLLDMVQHHERGNLADAAFIQRKLAQYYNEKGDTARARVAEQRAKAADGPSEKTPAPAPSSPNSNPTSTGRTADFTGKYWVRDENGLQTWDFNSDGTFYHAWIAGGAGTSARSSEKGTFHLSGEYLVLNVTSGASAFATPSVGGRGTLVGGGAEAKGEVRRLKIELLGPGGRDGIVLDSVKLAVKHW